jgi:predicted Zn-dependent peptidase
MVLTGGASSRLHRRLIGGKLAEEIGGQVLVRHEGGLLVAFARFSGEAAPVEKALLGEIDRLARQGPSAVELRRAKGQILGAAWLGMEGATGLANQIGVSWGLTGKPAGFLADLAALEKLSAADVRRAAGKYLAKSRLSLVLAEPGSASPAGGAR